MYLRPPSASEEARINDWIKVRQSGIKYYLSLGDQRIVDKNYIIRPRAEFEVNYEQVLFHLRCLLYMYFIVYGTLKLISEEYLGGEERNVIC